MKFERFYTHDGFDASADVSWEQRSCQIRTPDGALLLDAQLLVPSHWSVTASDILIQKYSRRQGVPAKRVAVPEKGIPQFLYRATAAKGTTYGAEKSAREIFNRLAGCWTYWGWKGGYFDSEEDALIFYDELMYMLIYQKVAPNSPQWFNTGLQWAYGITGPKQGHWRVDDAGELGQTADAYTHPQVSACFIQSVEDDLCSDDGIMGLYSREARLFKYGSGTGTNFSHVRGKGEPLSGGGCSSGLMSFLAVGDRSAGSIKSGGTCLVGDQQVYTTEGPVRVKDLAERDETFYVLSHDPIAGRYKVKPAQAWLSGQKKTVRVVTDKGEFLTSYDHPFITTEKRAVKAAELKPGTHLFRGTICETRGRLRVNLQDGVKGKTELHRLIALDLGMLSEDTACHVHHIDGDRLNNSLNNLQVLSASEHASLHGKERYGSYESMLQEMNDNNHVVLRVEDYEDMSPIYAVEVECPTKDDKSPNSGHNYLIWPMGNTSSIGSGILVSNTRRAAKLVSLDLDHPDIQEFVNWKRLEEDKVASLVAGSQQVQGALNEIKESAGQSSEPKENKALRAAIRKALAANVPPQRVQRTLDLLAQGLDVSTEVFTVDWDSEGYRTVSGQNSNNSVVVPDDFMRALEKGGAWDLKRRTDGSVAKTLFAQDLWDDIAYNAWSCADPGVQFITTMNDWHTCPNSGLIRASNPCSEYVFLDDTACNLASTNAVELEEEAYPHTIRIWTVVLDISVMMAQYPSALIAQKSYDFRTLGLGFANVGGLLMRKGLPYDSEEGRAVISAISARITGIAYLTSAEIARELGAFPKYELNKAPMLRVLQKHADAVREKGLPSDVVAIWDEVIQQKQFRNAQVSVVAPSGTIGFVMDCDTTGVEPDYALVKYKKLAGGGFLKIVNNGVRPALANLGYSTAQVDAIVAYVGGIPSLEKAPCINWETLAERGLSRGQVKDIEKALQTSFDFASAFGSGVLEGLGFSAQEILEASLYCKGAQTVEGAPHLTPEHLPVFDCASRCAPLGTRLVSPMGHLKMLAAVQPFISGSISKTVNMSSESTVREVGDVYREAWRLGLKAVAIYRDGSKLSQPLAGASLNPSDYEEKEKEKEKEKDVPIESQPSVVRERHISRRRRLPNRRSGYTQKAAIDGNKVYLHTGEYEDGSLGEIFIDMHKEGAAFRSLMNCFAISVSLGLQHGTPLEEYVDAFCFTRFDPSGMVSGNDSIKMSTSVIDYLFRELGMTYLGRSELVHVKPEQLYSDLEACSPFEVRHVPGKEGQRMRGPVAEQVPLQVSKSSEVETSQERQIREARAKGYEGDPCPTCANFTMIRNGTCTKCALCGSTSGCS